MPRYYNPTTRQIIDVANPEMNPQLIAGTTLIPDQSITQAEREITLPSGKTGLQDPLGNIYQRGTNPVTGLSEKQTITGESLTPSTSLDLLKPPVDTTNFQGIISGGQTLADFFKQSSTLAPEQPKDLNIMFEDLYKKLGLETKETKALESQKGLDVLQAQMAALSAEAKAAPLQVGKEFTGVASVGEQERISNARLRDIALRSLPLQGQILAQQAIATGDQRTLELAQNKFNTVFQIQQKSEQQQYEFRKENRDRIFDFLTKAEQNRLTQKQKEDDRKQALLTNNVNFAQDLVKKAVENGQSDIAAKLVRLDIKSPNFQQDLANLAGQIATKPEKTLKLDTQVVEIGDRKLLINTQTGKTIKDLTGTSIPTDSDKIIDLNLPNQEKNKIILTNLLKAKIGEGTRTQLGNILGVINASEDLAEIGQAGKFTGVSPLRAILDFRVPLPFTDLTIPLPFRQTFKQKGTASVEGYLEAINLKVQQWASGAALTTAQTEQVGRFTPRVTDTDAKVREKLNNLTNFMLTQAKSQLQTQGITFEPQKVDLFESIDLLKRVSPEQLEELKQEGLL